MIKLVLLRHGESQWNLENRFTGWKDVDLTEAGVGQAKKAGRTLKEGGFQFDMAFTSVLKRAVRTLYLAMEEMDMMFLPVTKTWRLNERHYGGLTGLNKAETAAKHGEEQVLVWRRSYDTPPPPMDDDAYEEMKSLPHYAGVDPSDMPRTECLKDTVDRFMPYWEKEIVPKLKEGKRVLIAAHGNSLRALVKYLDDMTPEQILKVNIPTGMPLVYELDDNLKPLKNYYLGDEDEVKAAMASVANQGKAK